LTPQQIILCVAAFSPQKISTDAMSESLTIIYNNNYNYKLLIFFPYDALFTEGVFRGFCVVVCLKTSTE
jgi:hypothetical protein